MKKYISMVVAVVVLMACSLLVVSCQDSYAYESTSLSVRIEGDGGQKTLMPSQALTQIHKYSLEGKGPDGASFGPIVNTSNQINVTQLPTGNWTITATALNAENNALASGQATINLKFGLNDVTVSLDEIPGSGSAKVNVVWDAGITKDSTFKISVGVENKFGSKITNNKNVNTSEGKTSFVFPLAAGSHIVTVVASDSNGTIAYGATEAVRVIDGTVTEGTIELKVGQTPSSTTGDSEARLHGSGGFNITNNTGMPMSFYLDYMSKDAKPGQLITLIAYKSDVPSDIQDSDLSYQWYIDGVLQTSSSSRMFSTIATAGLHRFDVVIKSSREGTLCSATLQATFKN